MDKQAYELELARIRYTTTVSLTGILVSAALVIILFFAGMKESNDIVSIVGIFTGITGTLVGTFLGIHIGSSGKEQERAEHRKDNVMKDLALGVLSERQMDKVMKMYKEEMGTEP